MKMMTLVITITNFSLKKQGRSKVCRIWGGAWEWGINTGFWLEYLLMQTYGR